MILGGVAAVFMPRNLETAPFFTDEERAFACMSCLRQKLQHPLTSLQYTDSIPQIQSQFKHLLLQTIPLLLLRKESEEKHK